MAKSAVFKKTKVKYMTNIPQAEAVAAMKDLSNGAYKLLIYYYSRRDGWVFDDEVIANTIGSSARQVKKFRKELISGEYLLVQKGAVDVYFVGKGAVRKFYDSVNASDMFDVQDCPVEPLVTGPMNGFPKANKSKEVSDV